VLLYFERHPRRRAHGRSLECRCWCGAGTTLKADGAIRTRRGVKHAPARSAPGSIGRRAALHAATHTPAARGRSHRCSGSDINEETGARRTVWWRTGVWVMMTRSAADLGLVGDAMDRRERGGADLAGMGVEGCACGMLGTDVLWVGARERLRRRGPSPVAVRLEAPRRARQPGARRGARARD
jgi:hypothetical protein